MATIRKRGKSWQAQIKKIINNKEIRESFTRPTKSEVQAWAVMREAELMEKNKKGLIVGNKHTLYEAFIKYRDEVTPTKKGAKRERIAINSFLENITFIGKVLSDIKPAEFAAWRDERLRSVSNDTVLRELTIFSSMYRKAIRDWGWCSINPITDIEKPKASKHRERLITQDEIDSIVTELEYIEEQQPVKKKQELAYLFLLAIETAMRQGELLSLTYNNVFLDKRFVHLDKTKNGDTRNVPLSPKAVYLFEQIIKNNNNDQRVFTLSSATADALFRRYRDKLGIKNLRFHDTRHEAITRLSKKLGVLELAKMVGHKNISQLMTYYNETAESIAFKLD